MLSVKIDSKIYYLSVWEAPISSKIFIRSAWKYSVERRFEHIRFFCSFIIFHPQNSNFRRSPAIFRLET